jgi:hypothetical protein
MNSGATYSSNAYSTLVATEPSAEFSLTSLVAKQQLSWA